MTDKEAMNLALEALDANYLLVNGTETHYGLEQCLDGYYSSCFDTDPINKQTEEAITAIKEALAEHAMREVQRLGQEIEQEPFEDLATELFVVAQTSPADDGFSDTIDRIETWLREHFSTTPQHTWVGSGDLEDSNAYLTPPQRTEQSGWRKVQIDDAEEEAWKEMEKKND